jgi:RNA polymerase sigma-54 factor
MELTLSAIQSQKLLITPQFKQSMEILQMSSIDLKAFILEQTADNPFVELNSDHHNVRTRKITGSAKSAESDWWLNRSYDSEISLEMMLLEQLNFLQLDRVTYRLCTLVIGSLNENGHLIQQQEWIADSTGVTLEQVEHAVHIIQSLEPSGVAASSLEECLLLQLDRLEDTNSHAPNSLSLARNLICNDLADIAAGKIQQLAKKYAIDTTSIHQSIDCITRLNPKPGALYSTEKPHYIIPDLQLTIKDGLMELAIKEASIPVISLNRFYINMMNKSDSKEVSDYLKKRWQSAEWFMQCIEQRKKTLLKVAGAIFDKQAEFCRNGHSFIQPLSMKQIADILQIHESTVSRTVSNKYVMTPWGLFKLKHFFASLIKHKEGVCVSALHMKQQIREAISNEDKMSPYSDQKITDLLQAGGFDISRRTVAKYREQMNILVAAQRKRY